MAISLNEKKAAQAFLDSPKGREFLDELTLDDSVFTPEQAEAQLSLRSWTQHLGAASPESVAGALFAPGGNRTVALGKGPDGRTVYTTPAILQQEKEIIEAAEALARAPSVLDDAARSRVRQRAQDTYRAERGKKGLPVRDDQLNAMAALSGPGRIFFLSGDPGTKKSTTIALMAEAMAPELPGGEAVAGRNILLLGPSGPALGDLTAKVNKRLPDGAGVKGFSFEDVAGPLKRKGGNPFPKGGVVFVDEAAMPGNASYKDLLGMAAEAECAIAFIGDWRQHKKPLDPSLPLSVQASERGDTFRMLFERFQKRPNAARLTKIERQDTEEEQARVEQHYAGRTKDTVEGLVEDGRLAWARKPEKTLDDASADYFEWRAGKKGRDEDRFAFVMTSDDKTAAELSRRIRADLKDEDVLGKKKHQVELATAAGPLKVRRGEQLVVTAPLVVRNGKDQQELPPGTLLRVTDTDDGLTMITNKGDEVQLSLDGARRLPLDYGYAVSRGLARETSADRFFPALTKPLNPKAASGWPRDAEQVLNDNAEKFAKWRSNKKHDEKSGMIVAADSAQADEANALVRLHLKGRGWLDDGVMINGAAGRVEMSPDEPVLFTGAVEGRNGRGKVNVNKGSRGTVVGADKDGLVVALDDGRNTQVTLPTNGDLPIRHGYAASSVAAQGAKVDRLYLALTKTNATQFGVELSRYIEKVTGVASEAAFGDWPGFIKQASVWTKRLTTQDYLSAGGAAR